MKKLIELYRTYGISTAKLRQLALEMEKTGRAEKRKELGPGWDAENTGKEVWHLDESVVLEYIAGQIKIGDNKTSKTQELMDQISQLQEENRDLQEQLRDLQEQLRISRQWSCVWKSYAKHLRSQWQRTEIKIALRTAQILAFLAHWGYWLLRYLARVCARLWGVGRLWVKEKLKKK